MGRGQAPARRPPFPPRSIFGHMSYRSEWELVKVDFRPSFPRTCREEDYGSWELADLQVGLGRRLGHPADPLHLAESPPHEAMQASPLPRGLPRSLTASSPGVFRPLLGAWAALGSVTLGGHRSSGPKPPME